MVLANQPEVLPSSSSAASPADDPIESSQAVAMDVTDLTDGRRLQFPIHDPNQVLLVAGSSIVTSRLKQLLASRGIRRILLNRADAANMASDEASGQPVRRAAPFDPGLAKRLDDLVESGRMFKGDAGPAFKERLVQHGLTGYSNEHREMLVTRHAETCSVLDAMIQSAIRGEPLSGATVAAVVADYLADLSSDVDSVLEMVRYGGHYLDLAEHCLQMSILGMAIGIEMDLAETDVRNIGICGLLHDWGMARVDPEIRNARRVLTRAEFLEVQKHPIYTMEMLRTLSGIPKIVPLICYQVHERPNGSGYPRGRTRDTIHPCARILQVADCYVALTSERAFRKPLVPHAAMECLLRQASENLIDGDAFRALLHVLSLFPIGSLVKLSDGSKARVLRRNGKNYQSPIVLIIEDANGEPTDPLDESQIIDPLQRKLKIAQFLPNPDRPEIGLTAEIQVLKRK